MDSTESNCSNEIKPTEINRTKETNGDQPEISNSNGIQIFKTETALPPESDLTEKNNSSETPSEEDLENKDIDETKDIESDDDIPSDCEGGIEIGDSFIEEDNEINEEQEEQLSENEKDDLNGSGNYNEWGYEMSIDNSGSNFLEPTCEIAESYESDIEIKPQVKASQRNNFNGNEENGDFCSGMSSGPSVKRLKFNFGKQNFRRQRPYTNEAVKEAIKMVQSKKMSILEASRQFDIPRTSLHNFIRLYKRGKKIGSNPISPGLTKQEESEMVSLVIKLSRCGKRYSHNELRFLIQYYLINNDRPVFKSGTLPTMGWIAGLVERQPDLITAKSKKNTKVDAEYIEEWQKQIEDYLVNDWELDIDDIFRPENGHRIFCFNAFKMTVNGPAENLDNKPQAHAKKEPGSEDEKDQEVGVILGMSADGTFEVPMIIFSEETREYLYETDPSVLRMSFNKTARIEDDVALQVVKDFDQEIVQRGIPKPVVFFVNDKQDMAHFSVIEYCWENQIVIICLPPKTTKTLSPFEVCIWAKVRSNYALLWKKVPKKSDGKLRIDQFPALFLEAWNSACVSKYAIRSFQKSGLIPFNVPALLTEPVPIEHFDDRANVAAQPSRKNTKFNVDSVCKEISSTLEEKSRGKLEGIQMCLEAIESFIPEDVLPVWNSRGADHRGRCELAFKLWKSVSLLLKAGCAMASIQQMADGYLNPFLTDFAASASSFQNSLKNNSADYLSPPDLDPHPSTSSVHSSLESTPKKRKLNKSIYSVSDAASCAKMNGNGTDVEEDSHHETFPFLRFPHEAFLTHSLMDPDI